ncbi:MAG: MFS transporter [Rhodoblastus sp.]
MNAPEPSRAKIVARIGVAQLIGYGGSYYLPAILAAPIGRELGLSPNWTFAGLSLALVVSSFIGPAVGRHVDQGGGRGALVGANIAFALGLALLGVAHGLAVMVAAWLVIGLGCGLGYYETAFAALTRLYGASARRLISGVTLIAGFTSTVAWPLMAWLEGQVGWRGVCLFWVAANLVIALPLNLMLPAAVAAPAREASPADDSQPAHVADPALERRAMTAIGLMFTATAIVSSGLSAIMPQLLAQFGVSQAAAIAASALIGPAQVAGRLAEMGWLSRYHPILSARLATIFLPLGAGAFFARRRGARHPLHPALRARQRHSHHRARRAAARHLRAGGLRAARRPARRALAHRGGDRAGGGRRIVRRLRHGGSRRHGGVQSDRPGRAVPHFGAAARLKR